MSSFLNHVLYKYRSSSTSTLTFILNYIDSVKYYQDEVGAEFIKLINTLAKSGKVKEEKKEEIGLAINLIHDFDEDKIVRVRDLALYIEEAVLLHQFEQMKTFMTRYFTMEQNKFTVVFKPLGDVVYEMSFSKKIDDFNEWIQFCEKEDLYYSYYDTPTHSTFVIFAAVVINEKISSFMQGLSYGDTTAKITVTPHDNVTIYASGEYKRVKSIYEIDCLILDSYSILQTYASRLPLLQIIKSLLYDVFRNDRFESVIFTKPAILSWFDDHKDINNLTQFQKFSDTTYFMRHYSKESQSIDEMLDMLHTLTDKSEGSQPSKTSKKKSKKKRTELKTETSMPNSQQEKEEIDVPPSVDLETQLSGIKKELEEAQSHIRRLEIEVQQSYARGSKEGYKECWDEHDLSEKYSPVSVDTEDKETNTDEIEILVGSPSAETVTKPVTVGEETFWFRNIQPNSLLHTLLTTNKELLEEILKKGDHELLVNLNNPFIANERTTDDLRLTIFEKFSKP